ncbi:MAG: heme exporter protein CcmB [Beijerinckiaceae bacterium]|nr:heme exporter protein CcmB [Beijerinckiaceae bacterium]
MALFVRDVKLGLRSGGGALIGLVFFLSVVTIVPFAIGPDLNLLSRIGPAVLWIAALLATLMGLDKLFQADAEDGALDLMRMGGQPLELVVAVKCLAHWTATCLPLVIAAPLFGLMLAMEPKALAAITATLAAGTPALTFIGSIGAALTATLRRGGLLGAILVLPLCIPVLIFGVAASAAATSGTVPFATPFMILCALSLFAMVLGPVAAAAAIRALGE